MDGAQCHRLVNGLRSAGYVTKTNSTAPRYRVSPKVLRLAARLLVKSDLLRVSRPVMVRLRDATGETVHLAVLHGGTPISIARELSLRRVGVMTQVGDSWTINEGAMGLVVGAYSAEKPADLSEELRARHGRIVSRGFSIDREEGMRGVVGVAAPVFDLRGEINGGLALAGPVDRIPVDAAGEAALGGQVAKAADEISYELGWLGPDAVTPLIGTGT